MRPKRTFKIQARRDADCPEVYANYCEATHSPFDLTLTFCSLTGIQPEDLTEVPGSAETNRPADPRARVTLPFKVVPALIKMLETQMRAVARPRRKTRRARRFPTFPPSTESSRLD